MRRIITAAVALVIALTGAGALVAQQATAASPVQHVVVIYLENHSFDNVLGYWCDQNPGRCPQGGMPSSVTLSDGTVVNPTVSPDTVPNVHHSVSSQLAAMNIQGGVPQMNGWQNIPLSSSGAKDGCGPPKYKCISGYTPQQVPNLTKLAQDFAINDDTFSMADSPSWGGHLYAAMGSLDGFTGDNPLVTPHVTAGPGWGCDSNRTAVWEAPGSTVKRNVPSCVPDRGLDPAAHPNGGAYKPTPVSDHATIFDSLDQAGLSWNIYGAAGPANGQPMDGGYTWSICPSFAECLYTNQATHLVDHEQFFTDAAAGTLPAFSIVTGGGSNGGALQTCHNGLSMAACDDHEGQLVQAIENSPDWSSTVVFITMDDFGGFYDQAVPGTNPDFSRQGIRVPLIAVSPFSIPGATDQHAATFAGILRYTELTFGLGSLSAADEQAYPFTNMFNYGQAPTRRRHMVVRPLPASARHIKITKRMEDDPT